MKDRGGKRPYIKRYEALSTRSDSRYYIPRLIRYEIRNQRNKCAEVFISTEGARIWDNWTMRRGNIKNKWNHLIGWNKEHPQVVILRRQGRYFSITVDRDLESLEIKYA